MASASNTTRSNRWWHALGAAAAAATATAIAFGATSASAQTDVCPPEGFDSFKPFNITKYDFKNGPGGGVLGWGLGWACKLPWNVRSN